MHAPSGEIVHAAAPGAHLDALHRTAAVKSPRRRITRALGNFVRLAKRIIIHWQ
jgi:hypothetical protein